MAPEGQKPAKWLCLTKLPSESVHNLLKANHFHGVLAGKTHKCSLISRIGKVSEQECEVPETLMGVLTL
jgi:hypothetical protein